MTPLTVKQKWERTKRWLRSRYPVWQPTRIVLMALRDAHGETELIGGNSSLMSRPMGPRGQGRFVIRIRRDQSHTMRIDSLLHEWAHVLTWFGLDEDDHAEEWGLAHSRIYRAWCDWDYGRKKKPETESED